jgi:hypothetical protein
MEVLIGEQQREPDVAIGIADREGPLHQRIADADQPNRRDRNADRTP